MTTSKKLIEIIRKIYGKQKDEQRQRKKKQNKDDDIHKIQSVWKKSGKPDKMSYWADV